jgi:hypothetical protein
MQWLTTGQAACYLGEKLQRRMSRQRMQQLADDPDVGLTTRREPLPGGDGDYRLISRVSLDALAERGLPDRRGRPKKQR